MGSELALHQRYGTGHGGRWELAMVRSKNVDSWIAEHDPAIRRICETLRNAILGADTELRESIKWGNPVYERRSNVCYLMATDEYVTLGFFNGARLGNPDGRIEGTGKSMRHVKIRALEDVDLGRVAGWMSEALALD
jgi:hypothetical protein